MTVPTTSQREVKKWRVIVFVVAAALLALLFGFFFQGFLALFEPWINVLPASTLADHTALSHWHAAMSGAMLGLLLAGSGSLYRCLPGVLCLPPYGYGISSPRGTAIDARQRANPARARSLP